MENFCDFKIFDNVEMHAYLVQCAKKSHNWFAFSTYENCETVQSSAINDGRSMFVMVLTLVKGLETETLTFGFCIIYKR